jgi:hypothetical protein
MRTDNSTACGIANTTVKQQRSKAIDMRFYWIQDRVKQGQFRMFWAPGSVNFGDYYTNTTPSPTTDGYAPSTCTLQLAHLVCKGVMNCSPGTTNVPIKQHTHRPNKHVSRPQSNQKGSHHNQPTHQQLQSTHWPSCSQTTILQSNISHNNY